MKINRGVGYCMQIDCAEFAKGVLVLNADHYRCFRCLVAGRLKPEKRIIQDKGYKFYRTVIVHFNYDPIENKYLEQAIVELEDVIGGNIYEIEAVTCKIDTRALKIGESALSAVNSGSEDFNNDQILRLSDSDEEFAIGLKKLATAVEERQRRIKWQPQRR